MKRLTCDVLIIGSGGAGLMSAYQAAKNNVSVAIVNKGYSQHTGATIMAPGAVAAVGEGWQSEGDSKDCHVRDTIIGGAYINNQEIVHKVVYEAEDAIKELEKLGIYFERADDGTLLLRTDGGHSYKRSLYLEDHIGREMVRTLMGAITKQNIPIYDNVMITRVILKDGIVYGAAGINILTQELMLFECTSIVVATGGVGFAYENSDLSLDLTGDGLVLALDCGLNLVDMEFVQFYPLGYLWPPSLKGLFGAYINHLHLLNSEGKRFMADYNAERMELTTRDILSSAMMREVREGRGSPKGGVFADFRHTDPEVMEKDMPGMCETYRRIGFDYRKDTLEIAPTAHFTMGGIEIDADWSTKIPGFFAAGEVCSGMHGANRVSQNALTDILVSGKIAGESASKYAANKKAGYRVSPDEVLFEQKRIEAIYDSKEGIPVNEYREQLKKILWEKVGVLRDGEGLDQAVEELKKLADTPQKLQCRDRGYNMELICALENQNMIKAAITISLAADTRCETRGAHIRTDYPSTDNANYLKNIFVRKIDHEYLVELRDVELKYYGADEL